MTDEEIKKMIEETVSRKIKEEKQRLSDLMERELRGTGEFTKAYRLMEIVKEWANPPTWF